MRKLFAAAAAAIVVSAVSFSTAMAQDKPTIGVVVKIGGIPWFNAMEAGIQSKAAELGVDAFMVGPTSADPALQVRAVEDLIARGVDVIGVVPNDAEVLEPVLARAREAGIIVLTHEAVGLQNKDFDFELITDKALGEANAKLFAESTGCTGKYAIFVGGLTVPAHNAWAKAAIDYLSANCPEMTMVADRFGVAESADDSRTTTLDLLRANPDLKGILSFGSQGPIGAARAVEERGLQGKVAVVGLFSAGQGQQLVHDGLINGGFMWSPLEAGEAFVSLGNLLATGGTVADGDNIDALGPISLDGNVIFADKPLSLGKETVDALAEMGL